MDGETSCHQGVWQSAGSLQPLTGEEQIVQAGQYSAVHLLLHQIGLYETHIRALERAGVTVEGFWRYGLQYREFAGEFWIMFFEPLQHFLRDAFLLGAVSLAVFVEIVPIFILMVVLDNQNLQNSLSFGRKTGLIGKVVNDDNIDIAPRHGIRLAVENLHIRNLVSRHIHGKIHVHIAEQRIFVGIVVAIFEVVVDVLLPYQLECNRDVGGAYQVFGHYRRAVLKIYLSAARSLYVDGDSLFLG